MPAQHQRTITKGDGRMSGATSEWAGPQQAGGTILLRRYTIAPDGWDPFLEVWHQIVPVRERHGFTVLFAFEDRETNIFTWAIEHHGDIDAASEAYYADPARGELETVRQYVVAFTVTAVTRVR
jgi:hypothetical protein